MMNTPETCGVFLYGATKTLNSKGFSMAKKTQTAAPAGDPKPPYRCPECRGAYWWRKGTGRWMCWMCCDAPPATTWQSNLDIQMHAVP